MTAAKLVLDEELARVAGLRDPASVEPYVRMELGAHCHGEEVFAFRNPMVAALVRSQRDNRPNLRPSRGLVAVNLFTRRDTWPKGATNEIDSNAN